jgi:hypothetical protein
LLGGLVGLALAQDGHDLVIDGDDTCPAALGRSFDAFAPITAVDPVMVVFLPSRSMSFRRRLSSSPQRAPV